MRRNKGLIVWSERKHVPDATRVFLFATEEIVTAPRVLGDWARG